jgi:hypothetical protein
LPLRFGCGLSRSHSPHDRDGEMDVASNGDGISMHFVSVSVMVDDFVGVRLDDLDQVVDHLDRQVIANRMGAG